MIGIEDRSRRDDRRGIGGALVNARIQGPSTIDRDERTNMEVPNLVVPITTDQGNGIESDTSQTGTSGDVMGLPIYYMSDPEDNAQVKRWLLEGADASRFTIVLRDVPLDADGERITDGSPPATVVKGGVLSFKKSVTYPNFESPMDVGGNNVYNVTVVATDNSVNMAKKDVTVSVKNMQEGGNIKLSTLQPEDGTPIEATLGDGDGGISGVVWQWYRSSTDDEDRLSTRIIPTVTTDDPTITGSWVGLIPVMESAADGMIPAVIGGKCH